MTMMDDGVKVEGKEDSLQVKDVAELVAESLPSVDEEYLTAVEEIARRQPQLPESPWER